MTDSNNGSTFNNEPPNPPPAPPMAPPAAPLPEAPMNSGSGFAIGDLINTSWTLFVENIGILLGGGLIIWLIVIGANFFTFGLAGIILQGPLMLGYYLVVLMIVRGQRVEFGNLFDGFKNFLPAFVANLLITIFTVIGILFCILPGLFVGLIYMFTFFFLADKNMDFWPAMEASRSRVMADLGSMMMLALAIVGLNLLGVLACGIGTIVTGPMSVLMLAQVYETIKN